MPDSIGTQPSTSVLICFAVKEEARFFPRDARVMRLVTGMGRSNAGQAFERALAGRVFDLVITCGFAGGLNPALKSEAIVFDADANERLNEALSRSGAAPVRFLCAERVAITAAEKNRLWRGTGLDAVEMESQAIREICQERGILSATVRVVLDSALEDLPLDFNTLMTPTRKINYSKLSWTLLRNPRKLAELMAFQQKTISAAKSLGAFLESFLNSWFSARG